MLPVHRPDTGLPSSHVPYHTQAEAALLSIQPAVPVHRACCHGRHGLPPATGERREDHLGRHGSSSHDGVPHCHNAERPHNITRHTFAR